MQNPDSDAKLSFTGSDLSEELSLVYSMHAATGSENGFETAWGAILLRLCHCVGASVAALSTYSFASGEVSVLSEAAVDAACASHNINPFCVRNPLFLSSAEFQPGRILSDSDLIGSAQFEKTDFYNDFLVPRGLRHWLCGVIFCSNDEVFYIEFLRAEGRGEFDDNACKRLNQMLGHIQLAMHNHWRLRHTSDLCHALRRVTDRTTRAIFLVDRHATLLHGNHASTKLLDEFDGLQLRNGCLCSSLPIHDRALLEAIKEVADSRELGTDPNVNVTLPGSNPDLSAIVQVHYVGEICSCESGQPCSAVVVSTRSPIRQHDPEDCLFADVYSLTPAQSRLSALVYCGYSLPDAARHLSVSENTLRSHLKQIYSKTNTHGQMEMVHLHARTCVEAF